MKIYLYWLIRNKVPYYVGVTRMKKQRYSGERKGDMEFIEEYTNRIEARKAEEYWIHQLKAWGFEVENKQETPVKLPYRSNNVVVVNRRFRLNADQTETLDRMEIQFGISQSEIVGKCVDEFLNLIKTGRKRKIDWSKIHSTAHRATV